ncbi:MAG: DNA-binding protein [Phycisphaerae bacterium]|nr:DNA-binding protein [Phycisphaerae bacterium]
MQYSVGNVGRVVVARLFEGEELHACIDRIAREVGIRCAAVLVTGGFREAAIVVGPEREQPQIVPRFQPFAGPGEVLGVGSLYWDDAGPRLHMHTAIGKDGQSLVGCARRDSRTFLILEVTIIEITGIEAARQFDPASGMHLLHLGAGG